MSVEKLILHSYRRCPFAIRVRMVLNEKEVPYEIVEEDLRNMSEELLRLHPEGRVPLLKHGKKIVYESSVITEYLDDAFKQNPLMPTDPFLRAQVRLLTYWCDNEFKPEIDRFKYGKSRGLSDEEWSKSENMLTEHLNKIDQHLADMKWLLTQSMTLADIHVFPFVRQLSKVVPLHSKWEDYINIHQWLDKIYARSSYEITMRKTLS